MSRPELAAVVLAAGKGKRLEPVTLRHSKAMTPILGTPILERVIDALGRAGVSDFVVVKGHEDTGLGRLCDRLRKKGLSIGTAVQEKRLGTAHALLQARNLIRGDFVLCSCDNLFSDEHLRKLIREHLTHRPPAVITLEPLIPARLDRRAGVRLDGPHVIEIEEKPGMDNADNGASRWQAMAKFLFTFEHRLLDYLDHVEPSPRGELEIQDALRMMMTDSDARPRGIFADECFHLSSEKDLIDIHKHYLEKHRPFGIHQSAEVHPESSVHDPVMIERGVEICSGAVVGPYVYVGESAFVGEGACVENTVIYPGARIEPGEKVAGKIRLASSTD